MHSLNDSFSVIYFLTIPFLLFPAVWHWRVGNTALLMLIFWLLVSCIPQAINSAIFYKTVDNVAPIWCDITTKLRIGADIGFAVASLCMTLQLESIAAARHVLHTPDSKRSRDRRFLLACLGIPLVTMVLHVVVQGHRYDIFPVAGCVPTTYYSVASLVMIELPPVALLLVSGLYAAITIRLFLARRYQFSRLLESSKSALTTTRFLRLVGLAAFQIAFMLPVTLTAFGMSLTHGQLQPYKSWAYVHDDFNTVVSLTLDEFEEAPVALRRLKELSLWLPAVLAILFFAFFGLGEESLNVYKTWFQKVCKLCGVSRWVQRKDGGAKLSSTILSLPTYPSRTLSSRSQGTVNLEPATDFPTDLSYKGVLVTVEKADFDTV